jgi:uncharacterized protein (TIGR02246 family)
VLTGRSNGIAPCRAGRVLLLLVVTGSCGAAPGVAPEARDERELVRSVASGILEADNRRDLEGVLALYSEDACLLPPNEDPVLGKQAIRPRYEGLFRDYQPEISGTIEEVEVGGNWAFVRGANGGRLVPRAGGEPRPLSDAFLMILRRDGGRWRIARLMWHPTRAPR